MKKKEIIFIIIITILVVSFMLYKPNPWGVQNNKIALTDNSMIEFDDIFSSLDNEKDCVKEVIVKERKHKFTREINSITCKNDIVKETRYIEFYSNDDFKYYLKYLFNENFEGYKKTLLIGDVSNYINDNSVDKLPGTLTLLSKDETNIYIQTIKEKKIMLFEFENKNSDKFHKLMKEVGYKLS